MKMKAKTVDKIATSVIVVLALFIVILLLGLLGFIMYRGIGHISWNFLTSAPQLLKGGGGIGPQALQLRILACSDLACYHSTRMGRRDLHGGIRQTRQDYQLHSSGR